MTDAQSALAQVREALANEALFDPGASTADTYGACKAFGTACTPENVRAILAHVEAQAAENERLTAERDELRDVLLRAGFVPCGIPACNCGSWHHRYGLPERMQEIKDALAEAGHELSNENGNLTLNALNALVSERDELRRQLDEAEQDARRYRWIAGHCRSTSEHWGGRWSIIVDGPAPKAHDSEDAFDAAIDAAMRLTRPAEE